MYGNPLDAMKRRTRIVATLGPATDAPGVLADLIEAGLDVARINYSHDSGAAHAERIAAVRRLSRDVGRPIAVLADLPGPKLRVLLAEPMTLLAGQQVSVARTDGAVADIHATEPEAFDDVDVGERILLDDGRLQLRAVGTEVDRVVLRVEVGGVLMPNKGLNLPDTRLSLPALTARDHVAIAAAAAAEVDWLALSFVRSADAAEVLRAVAQAHGLNVPVLAKIERPEAVENAAGIIEAFDGIMVARGDLGVEIPLEHVPHVQKRLIVLARAAGKPVVTATDMLDSMRSNPRPTRAEAADVANAVYDGTDALMLSGETAVGQFPVQAVQWMDRIAHAAESFFHENSRALVVQQGSVRNQMTSLTCAVAHEVNANAILVPTNDGRAAQLVARHRPIVPIVAIADSEAVRRQLAVVWGVRPVLQDMTARPGEDELEGAVRTAFTRGTVKPGDRVVVLTEHTIGSGERCPTVRVVRVGDDGQSCEP